jgi:hemolysin-activating ACP:hemolysin acyltransferase
VHEVEFLLIFRRPAMSMEPATAGVATGSIDPEKVAMARRAVAGKLAVAAFGEIVSILMRSPQYMGYTLGDLEWLVTPAVLNRQFSLVQMRRQETGPSAPVAVVMWASVTPEIEQKIISNLGQPLRLSPKQRKSGDRHWITDVAGDQRVIATVMQNLRQTAFKGAPVKTVTRSADGQTRVVQL